MHWKVQKICELTSLRISKYSKFDGDIYELIKEKPGGIHVWISRRCLTALVTTKKLKIHKIWNQRADYTFVIRKRSDIDKMR